MEHPPDAFEKNEPAAKPRDELIRLLLTLNAKLREKLSLSKKKETAPHQTDVVIIIMTNRQGKTGPGKPLRPTKTQSLPGDWMEDLFAEIEGPSIRRRKTS